MDAAAEPKAREPIPEIEAALAAMRAGDFGGPRRALLALRRDAPSEEVRRAADEVLDRMRPDPVAIFLFVVCLLGFIVVTLVMR